MKRLNAHELKFKRIFVSFMAGAAMLLLLSCGNSQRQQEIEYISKKYAVPQEKQLIVYTSHKEEVYLPIIREFETRTGIWVELHTGGTTEMFEQIKEASEAGECDIMFGGGIETFEAQKDLFMSYETVDKEILDPNYIDSEDRWTAFTELPIVFVYNKKLVSYSEAPKAWEDLFDERWKGKIAFADIHKSGTSYTILSTMAQIFDDEPDDLIPRFYEQLDGDVLTSSGEIIPDVSDGRSLVGITLEETARKAMEQGEDISMLYPGDGTSAVPDGCGILRNAPHSYNAGKFIDFVVSYDTQKYASSNFYRRSVRTDLTASSTGNFRQIDFDIVRSAEEESEIFALWDALIEQEGE